MLNLEALQRQIEAEDSNIKEVRETLNNVVKWFKAQPDYLENLELIADIRKLPVELLESFDTFYMEENYTYQSLPDWMRTDDVGLCTDGYLKFRDRWVIPFKDVKGDIMGWTGYSNEDDGPKYLDSKNYGFKGKHNIFYGMEQLPEAYKKQTALFVEGQVCSMYLRYNGVQAFALTQSSFNKYVEVVLKRFKRAVIIGDNDDAGRGLCYKARRLPNAITLQPSLAKDIDDTRKLLGISEQEDFINEVKGIMDGNLSNLKFFNLR